MTDPNATPRDQQFAWLGVLDPAPVRAEIVAESHRLADAAKVGDWSGVFDLLDDPHSGVNINWWRPAGQLGSPCCTRPPGTAHPSTWPAN